MDLRQSDLLWSLLKWHFLEKCAVQQPDPLSLERLNQLDWPVEIEPFVLEYSATQDSASLSQLALASVKRRYLPPCRHVLLVAALHERGIINIREALSMLTGFRIGHDGQDKQVRRVLDVVWLVNEDEKDALMKVEQDDLLATALHELLRAKPEPA